MKEKYHILIIGLLMILFGCSQTNNKSKSNELTSNTINNKDSIVLQVKETEETDNCNFNKYLNNPNTPNLAKRLFNGERINLDKDNPLFLLDSLKAKDKLSKPFYFRVITNSYQISDGYYSEGLGNIGKEYIENKTCEFASFFDNKECFTDKDLETWADIALLEFGIIGEIEDGKYDKTIVDNFNKKLKENCKNATTNQKATIEKFNKLLKNKYNKYLKEQ